MIATNRKILFLLFAMNLIVLPAFARIDGMVSKGHFYDADKTIMSESVANQTPKTDKYWDKNLLYFNKYRPLFLLSNKDLYRLNANNESVVRKVITPSVYNISLKTASIKKVSLSSKTSTKEIAAFKPLVIKKENSNNDLIGKYEQAKNPDVDSDQKLEAAVMLKNSKIASNYNLAIDLLNDVTQKESYNAYAFYLKGEIYSAQKDFTNAIKNYAEALKINPASKQSCLGIAKILEQTNKELAQKYYDRAKLCEK